MAKAVTGKKTKPKKMPDKEQAERFKETARQLGISVDDDENAQALERAFSKIAPPKRRIKASS